MSFLDTHGFIPELRLGDKISLSAWKKAPLSPKTVIVNFCDLSTRGLLRKSRIHTLRGELRESDTTILSTVGPDPLLDRLKIKELHDTALRLGADWVITPDDYIYEADSKYSFYQDFHFSRSIQRALTLLKMAKGQYSLIGLAIGSCTYQLQEFVRIMEEHEVDNFAFACGDLLKQARGQRKTLVEIRKFVEYLRNERHSSLLLGIDSQRFLRILLPDNWSSSAWSIDASRWQYYTKDGLRRRGYPIICHHDACRLMKIKGKVLFGVHNLLADRDFSPEGD